MKNAFYLMLKALFILEIFAFLPRPFGFVKKLDQKAKVNFKIYVIHILSNMSRSKVNQTMKFGQLIEDKIIYIFLGKSHTKCGREASLRLFHKKSYKTLSYKLEHFSRSKVWNGIKFTFIVCPSGLLPKYISKKVHLFLCCMKL